MNYNITNDNNYYTYTSDVNFNNSSFVLLFSSLNRISIAIIGYIYILILKNQKLHIYLIFSYQFFYLNYN